ncbi:polymorphic toxin-type HINT domain-containing protein [Chryseobacterium sp. APV1]|uniref:Polymorphic toxin-type HINT domain-containing protein n=1 Tax=Chryseobacterium urinae TaxID=3058400 RepID=A0ABT8U7A2_9FLAO|nr:polymorphic toxin-type HINT domain-containing protein [Chryseobacterium sp. APV1]MDO3426020.1 polymorphic toxin-type HINT domain-containing protein [Chryseobacterium sp. APV1]
MNGSWIEAKDLTKGMLLTTLDETTSSVESINFLDEKVKVYNFEVEDNHNYPDGTNSYWQNSSSDSESGGKPGAGGGIGSFVYVGGTAGLYAGYGIGSTLDFNGNFNSYYGTVTNGVLNYVYWTNGMPASGNSIQGLVANKGSLNLNSFMNKDQGNPRSEYSTIRKGWNFIADNIISKPVEGVEFFAYFFYGLSQVPKEMYKQGRMENIHVKMDMTLWGFKNGSFGRTMKYIDGETVMSEQEKFEKIAIPGIEALSFGVGAKLNLVKQPILNFGAKLGIKIVTKKTIYNTAEF